jgi:hypothetical protein
MNTGTGEIFFFSLYLNGRAMAFTQLRVQSNGILPLVNGRRMFALLNQYQGQQTFILYFN